MANVFRMTVVLVVLVVAVLLPECSGAAVTATACPNGDTDCTATNSICDGDASPPMCKCEANYRQNPSDDTACVAAIGTTCSSATDCTDAVDHSTCDTTCKCEDGYLVDATSHACNKVLASTCTEDSNCKDALDHSECTGTTGSMTCACEAGYGGDPVCALVLGLTCTEDSTCTDLMGTKCTGGKCQCEETAYKAESNICKTALEQTCTDTSVCVKNAACVTTKCKCNDDYSAMDGLCDSAQSVGISAAVLAVSMLVMLIQNLS